MRHTGMFKLIVIVALWSLCLSALHATTGVRELRSTPDRRSAPETDYALHTAPYGGASVTLIDVHASGSDWLRADPAKLPPLPANAPVAGKSPLQWFYGAVAGWMPAPAGWRLQRAEIGMDGGSRPAGACSAPRSAWTAAPSTPIHRRMARRRDG